MSSKTVTVQQEPYTTMFGSKTTLWIFRCEDLGYQPSDNEKYFVLEKSAGYGYFRNMTKKYTAGEILDDFKVTVKI